jgi:hypothetical protein
MKRQATKKFLHRLSALAIVFLISSLGLVQAQTTQTTTVTATGTRPLHYDAAKEITLAGKVSSVLAEATPGQRMVAGSHLLLATPSGPVDASLGRFGLRGMGAVSVAVGQQIEVTGVMQTIKDKPVFLVRSVKAGGELYTIRNEHGNLLSPQARERVGQKSGQQGGSL